METPEYFYAVGDRAYRIVKLSNHCAFVEHLTGGHWDCCNEHETLLIFKQFFLKTTSGE